jgi:hypothetical protein
MGRSNTWKKLTEDIQATPLRVRRELATRRAEVNPRPVIILGNQKAGTSAITNLLAEMTGQSVSQDFRN